MHSASASIGSYRIDSPRGKMTERRKLSLSSFDQNHGSFPGAPAGFVRREVVSYNCVGHGAVPGGRISVCESAAYPLITLFVLVFKSSSQREKNIENQNKSKGIVQSPLSFVGWSMSVYKYSCHISENTSNFKNASKVQKTAVNFWKRWVKSEIKRRLEFKKAMKN